MSRLASFHATFVKIGRVSQALPKVFDLMPSTNYQALVSHSAVELQCKAWNITGEQMRKAMNTVEQNVRRKHT